MTSAGAAVVPSRPRRVAYLVLTALLAVFAGAAVEGVPSLVRAWLSSGEDVIHRIHDVQHGVFMGIAATAGFAWQLRRPTPAGAQQIALVAVTFVLAMVGGGVFAAPVLVFVALVAVFLALHPSRGRLLEGGAPRPALAAVTAAGAVPLLWYAWGQLAIQRTAPATDPHVADDPHYAGAAAAAIIVVLLAAAASRRPEGWRLQAWCAGVGCAVLGVGSILFPAYASSFGRVWGGAAVVGGLVFVALAEAATRDDVDGPA